MGIPRSVQPSIRRDGRLGASVNGAGVNVAVQGSRRDCTLRSFEYLPRGKRLGHVIKPLLVFEELLRHFPRGSHRFTFPAQVRTNWFLTPHQRLLFSGLFG